MFDINLSVKDMNWCLIIFKYLLTLKTTPSNGLRNDVLPNALFKVYDLQ